MKESRSGRNQFNLSGLAGFLAFCIILGVLISFHSRNIDRISAFIFLGLRLAVGIAVMWMIWSSRLRSGAKVRSIPRWYRRWILGEDDQSPR